MSELKAKLVLHSTGENVHPELHLKREHHGSVAISSDHANPRYGKGLTATDLPNRRRIYKWLDHALKPIKLRYVPIECSEQILCETAPVPASREDSESGVAPQVWAQVYSEAVALVKHDDMLNWQKFNNMLYLNGALLTAYGVIWQHGPCMLLSLLSLAGIPFAIVFDLTLQEGMRCLRAHKAKVTALDRKLGSNDGFMFRTDPWNHRDALELGPLLLFVLWVFLFVTSFHAPLKSADALVATTHHVAAGDVSSTNPSANRVAPQDVGK